MYAGLYDATQFNDDALAIVVCHELGHLFGGAPVYPQNISRANLSAEGQADFWATSICMKRYIDRYPLRHKQTYNKEVKRTCNQKFDKENDKDDCARLLKASKDATDTLADGEDYSKLTLAPVSQTEKSHPNYNCRLKTYTAGTLCTLVANNSPNLIYDIRSNTKDLKSYCIDEHKKPIELRPNCWLSDKESVRAYIKPPGFYKGIKSRFIRKKEQKPKVNISFEIKGKYKVEFKLMDEKDKKYIGLSSISVSLNSKFFNVKATKIEKAKAVIEIEVNKDGVTVPLSLNMIAKKMTFKHRIIYFQYKITKDRSELKGGLLLMLKGKLGGIL